MTDTQRAEVTDECKVFISYSRQDEAFAEELLAGLRFAGFAVSIDRHSIRGAEDWKARLSTLIGEADTVVFILSPDSARSATCQWEVDHSLQLSKRIVPVLVRPLENAEPPSALASLNYIRFEEGRSFMEGLVALDQALRRDLDWLQEHTRLLLRASEWAAAGRQENRMLVGTDIDAAKVWLARRKLGSPEPTQLQLDYIRASELAEARRQSDERRRLAEIEASQNARSLALERAAAANEARRRQQKVATVLLIALAAVLAGGTVATLVQLRSSFVRQEQAFIGQSDTNIAAGHHDRALLLALSSQQKGVLRDMLAPPRPASEAQIARAASHNRTRAILSLSSADIAQWKLRSKRWSDITGAPVVRAVFNKDATKFAVALAGLSAGIYTRDGEKLLDLSAHTDLVVNVEFSPDGSMITTSSMDGTARLWSAQGKAVAVLGGHKGAVRQAHFNNQGTTILTVSDDRTARLWDATNGEARGILEDIGPEVWQAAFSSDGTKVAFAGDGGVQLWDAKAGKRIATMESNTGFTSVEFSPDGTLLVAGGADNAAHIWQAHDGSGHKELKGHAGWIWSARFSKSGKYIVTSSSDTVALLWNVATGREVQRFVGHSNWVLSAAFSPDDKYIATTSRDGTARIWEVKTGPFIVAMPWGEWQVQSYPWETDRSGKAVFIGHEDSVWGTDFSADGELLLTASIDGTARLWSAQPTAARSIGKSARAPTGSSMEAAYSIKWSEEDIEVVRDSDGAHLGAIKNNIGKIEHITIGSLGRSALIKLADGRFLLFDVQSGEEIKAMNMEKAGKVLSTLMTKEGVRMIVQSSDGMLRALDFASGRESAVLPAATPSDRFISIDGNEERFLLQRDTELTLWSKTGGKWHRAILETNTEVRSAIFNTTGTRLITISVSNVAELWDAPSGTRLGVYKRGQGINDRWGGGAENAAFNSAGSRAAIMYTNGEVGIYDTSSGLEILSVPGDAFVEPGGTVGFAGNDRRLWSSRGTWELGWQVTDTGGVLLKNVCAERPFDRLNRKMSPGNTSASLNLDWGSLSNPCEK